MDLISSILVFQKQPIHKYFILMTTLEKLISLTTISIKTLLALLLSEEGIVLTTEKYACGHAEIIN